MFSNCQQFWWWNQATDLHSYIFIYSKLTLVIHIANIEQRTTSVSLCTYTGSSCLTIRSDVTSHAIPDTVYLPCIQNWFELTWTVHSQLSRWWWSNGRNWCNASSSRTGKSQFWCNFFIWCPTTKTKILQWLNILCGKKMQPLYLYATHFLSLICIGLHMKFV